MTATLRVGEGEVVKPGDHVTLEFALHAEIAIEPGMRFAMRESGKTIGAGVVIEVR